MSYFEQLCGMQIRSQLPNYFVISVVMLLTALSAGSQAGSVSEERMTYQDDIQAILTGRTGMQSLLQVVDSHPEIFSTESAVQSGQLNREQRLLVWQTWQSALEHIYYFDTLGSMYAAMYGKADNADDKARAFSPAFACFLSQYRFAMEYIDRMEKNPDMHTYLNDRVVEFGLKKGAYSRIKFRFLNVARGAEFVRLNVLHQLYEDDCPPALLMAIEQDSAAIWEMGRGQGPKLTVQNALKVVGELGFTAWFPVQKNVSELMGEIKVWRHSSSLISADQIRQLSEKLQPGDILLQRREWYATNIGIPGFWTHAALYIGSLKERTTFFSTPGMRRWCREQGGEDGSLDSVLQHKYPHKYYQSSGRDEFDQSLRVIEAIAGGVSFTALEHSAAADSIVVLRPRLTKPEIAQAIIKAYHYSGRPYDFNFDFRTDSALVCSELIYKAFEGSNSAAGLSLPLQKTLERPLLTPNQIAEMFAEEFGTARQQLAFVAFLDGNEGKRKAFSADVYTFLESWKRPKYHILLQ